jgi:putative glutamine amidotransferase
MRQDTKQINKNHVIGIVCPNKFNYNYDILSTNRAYGQYFKKFGEIKLIRADSDIDKDITALVLTGGADINPIRYGQAPTDFLGSPNLMYEFFETNILPKYIDKNIPIIGICRGFQCLYVEFGGKLIQHVNLPTSVTQGNFTKMHQNTGDRSKIIETLVINPKFKWLNMYDKGINSLHHQIADTSKIPDNIIPIAYSKENKNLEILKIKGKNIVGMQYHPKFWGFV